MALETKVTRRSLNFLEDKFNTKLAEVMEKVEEIAKTEVSEQFNVKIHTWLNHFMPSEFKKSQKQIQELSEALVQVHQDNKNLREEVEVLKKALADALELLAQK